MKNLMLFVLVIGFVSGCVSGPLNHSFPYYSNLGKEDVEAVRKMDPANNNVYAQTRLLPFFYNRRTIVVSNGCIEITCRTRMPHCIPKTNELLGTICIRQACFSPDGKLVYGLEEHQINPVMRFAFTWNSKMPESWNIELFKGLAGIGYGFGKSYFRLFWKIHIGNKGMQHHYHNDY